MSKSQLDKTEAPEGYEAKLKSDYLGRTINNLCRECDWRPTCQRPDTDFSKHNHRCMSFPVVSLLTGETIERKDGCSVVFKKLEAKDGEA